MKTLTLAMLIAGLMTGPTIAAEDVTECDRQASHPSDPEKILPGLNDDEMNFAAAQVACEAAVQKDPNNKRLRYQLGRAYFYDKKFAQGLPHVKWAADQGYQQAQFVYGYIVDNGFAGVTKEPCLVEDYWVKSARQGRMAARISYPHHVVRGLFKGCTQQANNDEMQGFLDAAVKQADGYYEKLMVSMLQEEFATFKVRK
jgi:hypothetical protein